MRNFYISLSFIFVTFSMVAQTGPAGVGNSSNNILWLNADSLTLNDNDAVSTWDDLSGNSNDAAQGVGSEQPIFRTASINGRPSIEFDGSDYLELGSHITSSELSFFTIFSSSTAGAKTIFTSEKHIFSGRNVDGFAFYNGTRTTIDKNWITPSLFSVVSDGVATGNFSMTCDGNYVSNSRTNYNSLARTLIGAWPSSLSNESSYFTGFIPEIIVYNNELDSASRNILINYLATKYSVPAFVDLYSFDATHPHNLAGIGKEASGENSSARSASAIEISNASTFDNGDYIMFGHNNAGYTVSNSVPADYVERLSQVWRADVTGTPGTVDIEIFLDVTGVIGSPSNLAVIIETNDGDFTNGNVTTHTAGRSYSVGTNSVTFTGVSLSDGDYFTLGELQSDITAIANGDWDQTSTWSCTCIPSDADVVLIGNTFDVTLDSDEDILNLTVDFGGSLTFNGSNTLSVKGDLTVNGTLNSGNGTIVADGTLSQSFDNGSGSNVELNSITVNNVNGLDVNSGEWSIASNLQVSSGNFDVSGATSFTLVSNASSTSQVLESVNNAFTGNFTVQRFIGTRNANYSNFGIPINGATVADIDDDLFISGVGGADGNATVKGGGIFYSIQRFNRSTDAHEPLTALTDNLSRNRGYEVYLASALGSFSGATVDYTGDLNNGKVREDVNQGWNLLGNPYHCFVDWDLVSTTGPISSDYYIFDTDAGSYTLYSGAGKANIAPGQGFWVFQANTGGFKADFEENDKVASNSSTFVRKNIGNEYAALEIVSLNTNLRHRMELHFDIHATEEFDNLDAPFLPSPIKEAPAIYSRPENSDMKVVKNSLNANEETHVVPISIFTGQEGNYSLNARNLEGINDSYSCVFLKDNKTNESIDLSVEHEYSFQSNVVDDDNRFKLVLSNAYDACQNLLDQKGSVNQKLDDVFRLRNYYDDWFLDYSLHNEGSQAIINVYNLSGQSIMEPLNLNLNGSGSIPIHQLRNLEGVYMIQVISNDEILNQTVKL